MSTFVYGLAGGGKDQAPQRLEPMRRLGPVASRTVAGRTVAGFVGLTYMLSWLVWLSMLLVGGQANVGVLLLGIAVPSTLGVVFTYRTMPRPARSDLWSRLNPRRLGLGWLLVCVLVLPVLQVAGSVVYALLGHPTSLSVAKPVALLGHPYQLVFVLLGLVVGGPLAEELGWRGYALDHLQARWNSLVASLVLGVVWAGWHLPLFFIPGTFQYAMGFDHFGLFAGSIISLTVIITWVYNRTGRSVLAAVVLHFCFNACGALLANPDRPTSVLEWEARLGALAAFALVVGLVELRRSAAAPA